MLHIERVLKQTRLCLALTGLRPEEFLNLLPAFDKALKRKKHHDYENNPDRQRSIGGGRKGFVPSVSDKLFFLSSFTTDAIPPMMSWLSSVIVTVPTP